MGQDQGSIAGEKIKLDRTTLRNNGIFIFGDTPVHREKPDLMDIIHSSQPWDIVRIEKYLDAEIREPAGAAKWIVPNAASSLAEHLLDIRNILPSFARTYFTQGEWIVIPEAANAQSDDCRHVQLREKKHYEERFEMIVQEYRRIHETALGYLHRGSPEDDWQAFMRNHIFSGPQIGQTPAIDSPFDLSSFDTYEVYYNALWSNSTIPGKTNTSPVLQDPKPDCFFGFPIHKPNLQSNGLGRSPFVKNFSLERLSDLAEAGLVSNPLTDLTKFGTHGVVGSSSRTVANKTSKKHDFFCFPFAIVELKHGSVEQPHIDYGVFQAANGASRALNILEHLYAFADQSPHNSHVPPVVAFTSIGPKLRVWIAYSIRKSSVEERAAHVMVCIRELDLSSSTWVVFEMQSIVRNLLFWATRVHKPNISNQISRWRLHMSGTSDPDHTPCTHEQRKDELLTQLGDLMTSENELSMENWTLNARIERLERENIQLKEQRDHEQDQERLEIIKAVESELEKTENLRQSLLDSNRRLQQDRDSLKDERDRLENESGQLRDNRNQLKVDRNQLKVERDELHSLVKEIIDRNERLAHDTHLLRRKWATISGECYGGVLEADAVNEGMSDMTLTNEGDSSSEPDLTTGTTPSGTSDSDTMEHDHVDHAVNASSVDSRDRGLQSDEYVLKDGSKNRLEELMWFAQNPPRY